MNSSKWYVLYPSKINQGIIKFILSLCLSLSLSLFFFLNYIKHLMVWFTNFLSHNNHCCNYYGQCLFTIPNFCFRRKQLVRRASALLSSHKLLLFYGTFPDRSRSAAGLFPRRLLGWTRWGPCLHCYNSENAFSRPEWGRSSASSRWARGRAIFGPGASIRIPGTLPMIFENFSRSFLPCFRRFPFRAEEPEIFGKRYINK